MKTNPSRRAFGSAGSRSTGSGGPEGLAGIAELDPRSNAEPAALHRVLLVEDQPDVARATVMGLEHLGAEVCVAETGTAALEKAPAFRPTLVLLDIDLPDMTGHEVGRRLRQMRELSTAALVALTSWNTEEMRQRSADAGLCEHLAKPLDLDSLASLLNRTRVRTG